MSKPCPRPVFVDIYFVQFHEDWRHYNDVFREKRWMIAVQEDFVWTFSLSLSYSPINHENI